MKYISTRGRDQIDSFLSAILQGLARDGGLYVPERWPDLTEILPELKDDDYISLSTEIFDHLIDDLTREEIEDCVRAAYSDSFPKEHPVTVSKGKDRYFLELYHGPTAAFKDFALCLLPRFMEIALKKRKEKDRILILTATSGDTGKAALEGFKDVEGIDIVVYYPTDGISEIQRRQMITQEGENTTAIGIYGNFDDAQKACKEIFGDEESNERLGKEGYRLSSANSINIGRLLPQINYYIYGYLELCRRGEIDYGDLINIVVPTGNFGNILASYYAKKIGLPVDKFICASNANSVLTDFFRTGVYDARRPFYKTLSPSMDILVSSNLERFLYELTDDTEQVLKWMEELGEKGKYDIEEYYNTLRNHFYGYTADDGEALEEIRKLYGQGVLVDTHTAVGSCCLNKYREETKDEKIALIAATASPYKFGPAVAKALGIPEEEDEFNLLEKIEELTGEPIPDSLADLREKPITQKDVLNPEDIKKDLLRRAEEDVL